MERRIGRRRKEKVGKKEGRREGGKGERKKGIIGGEPGCD